METIDKFEAQVRVLRPSWSNAQIREYAVNMYYLGWKLPE
jgi:hypothetical protein